MERSESIAAGTTEPLKCGDAPRLDIVQLQVHIIYDTARRVRVYWLRIVRTKDS